MVCGLHNVLGHFYKNSDPVSFFTKFIYTRCMCVMSFICISFCSEVLESKPINLSQEKKRVERYYECGQYDKDLCKVINCALRHFEKIRLCKKSTVLFDVDDTVLSDYWYEKTIAFGLVPSLLREWALRANSPAIMQTKYLYDYLVDRGFTIIFLTGRTHDLYDATIKNLYQQGFKIFERLIVRQKDEEKLTAEVFKNKQRKKLTDEGFCIVGCVGDQASDLKGGYTGYKVKVPNVRYVLT